MRKLKISFGKGNLAKITATKELSWEQFRKWLTAVPPELDSKDARGWYCGAHFFPERREAENFVGRDCLTLDVDQGTWDMWAAICTWFEEHNLAYALYTTFSHTEEKPRFRVVIPLDRSATYDEFQAVSRRIAESFAPGAIEFFARESHVPAQLMFAPGRSPGGKHRQKSSDGRLLPVDEVLESYGDWADRSRWPRRKDHDATPADSDQLVKPFDKPGIIGLWNRTFSIEEAISKFDLPYVKVR